MQGDRTSPYWLLDYNRKGAAAAEDVHTAEVFVCPRTAIRVLAERIRPRYAEMIADVKTRNRRVYDWVPDVAPDNPHELVAYFFVHPRRQHQAGHERYYLDRCTNPGPDVQVNTEVTPPGDVEYIFQFPYQEWECLCGNHPASSGFSAYRRSDGPHGQITHDGPTAGFEDLHICPDCGRVMRNGTGRVVDRISATARALMYDEADGRQ